MDQIEQENNFLMERGKGSLPNFKLIFNFELVLFKYYGQCLVCILNNVGYVLSFIDSVKLSQ